MRGRTTQNPDRDELRMRSGVSEPWGNQDGESRAHEDRMYGERDYRGIASHQPLRAQWDPTKRQVGKTPRTPRPDRSARKQSRLGKFVATYGWRAYAIPVLAILTIFVIFDALRADPVTDSSSSTTATADLAHSTDGTDVIGAPPAADGEFAASIPSGALPDGGPFAVTGGGTWHIVPGTTGKVGQGTEREFTYTVEIEDGVDTTGFGGDESYGRMIDQTLANPKSWTNDPKVAFRRIDSGSPDFRISLTSQMTIRDGCGYEIELEGSCYNPGMDRVLLNEPRWVRGAISFQGDIGSYRQYQINHEVGHAIGYAQHQPCETEGGLAPIMMQQTFGTANNDIAVLDPDGVVPMNGLTCRFNPWPYPRA
ncbi:DUF3152 domain-containing protein [Rhodococcus sp. ACPA4]|uniref:Uncharacterized protein DUF3152 n=2 Tax=Nocardiaceae TaxID=85025 RepID=A0A652YXX2_NOCGL|nr:DUF3152 domain-containing protein [Rhodococcus globerulus]NMD59118.1 DUF3152 domain-containing protein [Nocardia globerula]PBC41721.1 DUF3152 domain-containing protein [Rhodococcus sp. ACPA4]PVX64814.1 uncharacterized protein DUF3152 [Rhodococcus globerulus]ROZ48849.1 DUF3152 domain-containing protein [Rhodococcus sp. WS3]